MFPSFFGFEVLIAFAYEGIIEKKQSYKNGLKRSNKIDKLINSLDDSWMETAWDKVNKYYAKVVSTNPVEGVIHRNSIVHGDCDKELIEVDEFSAFTDRYGKIVVDGIVGSLPRAVDFVDEIKTEFHNFILRFSRLYANTTISFLHSRLVISDNIFTLSREVEKNGDMGYDLKNVR